VLLHKEQKSLRDQKPPPHVHFSHHHHDKTDNKTTRTKPAFCPWNKTRCLFNVLSHEGVIIPSSLLENATTNVELIESWSCLFKGGTLLPSLLMSWWWEQQEEARKSFFAIISHLLLQGSILISSSHNKTTQQNQQPQQLIIMVVR
jgi:hypothetical protein